MAKKTQQFRGVIGMPEVVDGQIVWPFTGKYDLPDDDIDPPPTDEPQLPEPDEERAVVVVPSDYENVVIKRPHRPGEQFWLMPGNYIGTPGVVVGRGSTKGTEALPIVYRKHPDYSDGDVNIIAPDPWPPIGRHLANMRFAPGTENVFINGITFGASGHGPRGGAPNDSGDQFQIYSNPSNISHDIVVSECKFVEGYGKSVLAAGDNLWFLDNTFDDCCRRNPTDGTPGAAVLSTWHIGGQLCQNVVMRRNRFGESAPNYGEGCHGSFVDGITIEDNVLTDGSRAANIWCHNSKNGIVRRNRLQHVTPQLNRWGRKPYGIGCGAENPNYNPDGCADWLIEDNELIGDFSAGVFWVNWNSPDTPAVSYTRWTVRRNQFVDWNPASYKLLVHPLRENALTPEGCTHDITGFAQIGNPEYWNQ